MKDLKNVYGIILSTGKCFAVDSWKNENSEKDQVTVQFAQEITKPSASGIVAIAQGTGRMVITSLMSFKRSEAERHGLYPFSKPVEASAIFGIPVGISVIENFEKNPKATKQEPVVNPSTGEICTSNGKPVYRHTNLDPAEKCIRSFKELDRVAVPETSVATTQAASVADLTDGLTLPNKK